MKTPEIQCVIGLMVDDNVVMKDFDLTTKEITELKRLHRMLSHRKDADKVKAVILLGTGWSAMQVAEILLLDEKTLRRYMQRYQENPEGDFWLTTFHQGSQAKVSEDQITLLDQHLEETVYLTVEEIAEYVKKDASVKSSLAP
jgi:transposase